MGTTPKISDAIYSGIILPLYAHTQAMVPWRDQAGDWPFCRTWCCVAGKVYVVGGNDGTSSLATTEIYDPDADTWTSGPTMSMPRANVACIVLDNRLWAVGGFNGKTFLDSMEYLNSDAKEWCSYLPSKASAADDDGTCSPTPPATPVKKIPNGGLPALNGNPQDVNGDPQDINRDLEASEAPEATPAPETFKNTLVNGTCHVIS